MAFGFLGEAWNAFGIVTTAAARRLPVVRLAVALATPITRTLGWAQREIRARRPFKLSPQLEAAERLLTPGPNLMPFWGSVIEGAAYMNTTEMLEGWLSPLGEFFFLEKGGARKVFVDAVLALGRDRDVPKFFDVLADYWLEEKLEDPAAMARGLASIWKDIDTLTGLETLGTNVASQLWTFENLLIEGKIADIPAWWNSLSAWIHGLVQARDEGKPPPPSTDFGLPDQETLERELEEAVLGVMELLGQRRFTEVRLAESIEDRPGILPKLMRLAQKGP